MYSGAIKSDLYLLGAIKSRYQKLENVSATGVYLPGKEAAYSF